MAATTNGVDYSLKTVWMRFWFSPTDPTTLGFIRVITGLLVLYLHLAYVFDYTAFFGEHAWFDRQTALKQRIEFPIIITPLEWGEIDPSVRLPETKPRRDAVIAFLRGMPDAKEDRARVLKYIAPRVSSLRDNAQLDQANKDFVAAMEMAGDFIALLGSKAKVDKFLTGVAKEPMDVKELPFRLPDFMLDADRDARVKTAAELVEFASYLAKTDPNTEDAEYVLTWWKELLPSLRQQAVKFIEDLPKAGAERDHVLDYTAHWIADPRQTFTQGRYCFSFWFHASDPTTMRIVFVLHLVAIVCFTLGIYTRVSAAATWFGALNLIHRNNQVLFGMDAMMMILLFYLTVGPSGAALSFDRLRARYRAAKALRLAGGKPLPWAEAALAGPQPSRFANCIVRMMQVHFCFMYLSAGFSKLKGNAWWNMTAPWGVLANPEFCPVNFRYYEDFLYYLAHWRPVFAVAFVGMVFFTLAVEIGLPFLVWTRFRPYAVMGSILLHLGIDIFMGLTIFSLLMMTWVFCFIPARLVRRRVCPEPGGERLELRGGGDDPNHGRTADLLRAVDVNNQLAWIPEKDGELKLATADAKSGGDILNTAFDKLGLLQQVKWMLWIPGAKAGFSRLLRLR